MLLMDPSIILAAIGVGIWLVLVWLRVPAVLMFFSLLVGQLLATQIMADAYEWLSSLIRVSDPKYVQLALLLLPVFLSILFLKGRLPKAKMVMEAIPMLFVVASGLFFAAEFLPSVQQSLEGSIDTVQYKSLIIISASISSLVSAWFTYPKHHSGDKKHKK